MSMPMNCFASLDWHSRYKDLLQDINDRSAFDWVRYRLKQQSYLAVGVACHGTSEGEQDIDLISSSAHDDTESEHSMATADTHWNESAKNNTPSQRDPFMLERTLMNAIPPETFATMSDKITLVWQRPEVSEVPTALTAASSSGRVITNPLDPKRWLVDLNQVTSVGGVPRLRLKVTDLMQDRSAMYPRFLRASREGLTRPVPETLREFVMQEPKDKRDKRFPEFNLNEAERKVLFKVLVYSDPPAWRRYPNRHRAYDGAVVLGTLQRDSLVQDRN